MNLFSLFALQIRVTLPRAIPPVHNKYAARMTDNLVQSDDFLAHLDNGRGQLLRDHLTAVSRATRHNSEKIGMGTAGAVIGLLHDLGKYSSAFQDYLRRMALTQDTEQQNSERGTVDHSTAGSQLIWRSLKVLGPQEGVAAEILALCIASHHSGLIDCVTPRGEDNITRRMSKADAASHLEEVVAHTESTLREAADGLLQDTNLIREIGEIVGKIGRLDKSKKIRQFKIGLLVRFLFSCLIDGDRTDTADFSSTSAATIRQRGRYVEWPVLSARLESELRELPVDSAINLLRREVSEACLVAAKRDRGTYFLTVPTGGGKTLASLRFALHHAAKWRMDRIIYVTPYTSIIDQNARVARKILEPDGTDFGSILLEHHSNLTPEQQTWRSKLLSENWDAPVVFTTAVQVLESLFGAGTRAVRRMHQMANAVLVFDEIQTLPVRCALCANMTETS